MNLDRSCIFGPFRAYRTDIDGNVIWTDTRDSYLIDANLLREAAESDDLSEIEKAEFSQYIYNPTPAQIEANHLPAWGGNDPPARYVRLPATATPARVRRFFRKRVRDAE